jgi:hypothetical protein
MDPINVNEHDVSACQIMIHARLSVITVYRSSAPHNSRFTRGYRHLLRNNSDLMFSLVIFTCGAANPIVAHMVKTKDVVTPFLPWLVLSKVWTMKRIRRADGMLISISGHHSVLFWFVLDTYMVLVASSLDADIGHIRSPRNEMNLPGYWLHRPGFLVSRHQVLGRNGESSCIKHGNQLAGDAGCSHAHVSLQ